jgi:hypothetical protein
MTVRQVPQLGDHLGVAAQVQVRVHTGLLRLQPQLYVVVPLGFTPPKWTLQCPAGHCIDHPNTIDLSAVLGKGTSNVLLPAHSHIVATNNDAKSEWWNVDVVGVKSLSAWDKIVAAKSDWELQQLQRTDSSQVTGNITTNLFLYFAVVR